MLILCSTTVAFVTSCSGAESPMGVDLGACGDSTDPADTGEPTVMDACDASLTVDFSDAAAPTTCAADPVQEVITRTWTVTDDSGNQNECPQEITVLKVVLDADIKPGSCPNSYNPERRGFLPVGILGTLDFDVADVDVSSVELSRTDCVGGTVGPNEGPPGPNSVIDDVGTPFDDNDCGCHELEGDGLLDLSMKYRRGPLSSELQLDTLLLESSVELTLSGELAGGECKFIALDCIRLVPRSGP